MKGGEWLSYMTDVAQTAGHPVPRAAITLEARERMAWGGALDGIADKLRAVEPNVSADTDLRRAVDGAIRKIDAEYRMSEAAILSESSHATPEQQH